MWNIFLLLASCSVVSAALGRSIGLRRLYVRCLYAVFEFAAHVGREHHEQKRSNIDITMGDNEEDDDDDDDDHPLTHQTITGKDVSSNGSLAVSPSSTNHLVSEDKEQNNLKLERLETKQNVISRDHILTPEGTSTAQNQVSKQWQTKLMEGREVSVATFQREFELSDILEYIKGGMESVIEDEVTQRFVAEELTSWNLLTRSSQRFEFVNWRLTIMWIMGFIFRYGILLPVRSLIFVIGLMYLSTVTTLVGQLPERLGSFPLRRMAYEFGSVAAFRILTRSFSAVVNFHNKHYRPKPDGICVANHTSPIDVAILQNDRSYALFSWLGLAMHAIGFMKESSLKKRFYLRVSTSAFHCLSGFFGGQITFHNCQHRPKSDGICVANHTSPIDLLILSLDNAYTLVGQLHGGLFGLIERLLSRAASHMWFERSEMKDRIKVGQKLRDHVEDPEKLPILIFPEGTCINNTSVMQFKKGSFEVSPIIYPVAMKYDPLFGDAFWNSSEDGMLFYFFKMMTSWAIVCDVWYLPPMVRRDDESALHFANRVKAEIARQGGLVDLVWDGNLKRQEVKSEWKQQQQEEFSKRLKWD